MKRLSLFLAVICESFLSLVGRLAPKLNKNETDIILTIFVSLNFYFPSIFRKLLGMLYVFGRNNHGQLATGDTDERHSPHPVDNFIGTFCEAMCLFLLCVFVLLFWYM